MKQINSIMLLIIFVLTISCIAAIYSSLQYIEPVKDYTEKTAWDAEPSITYDEDGDSIIYTRGNCFIYYSDYSNTRAIHSEYAACTTQDLQAWDNAQANLKSVPTIKTTVKITPVKTSKPTVTNKPFDYCGGMSGSALDRCLLSSYDNDELDTLMIDCVNHVATVMSSSTARHAKNVCSIAGTKVGNSITYGGYDKTAYLRTLTELQNGLTKLENMYIQMGN